MYLIMIYDVNKKRVGKVLKVARKYLKWVQNSVLEGKITESNFETLRNQILSIIDEDEDTIYWYILEPEFVPYRKIYGNKKINVTNII
ncbi:CRISPR-associated endonuclease Cas2 [Thermosipho globiformans]|uniref:CRISPR-associated endonuclease Cas2 n=1 Tax=Thermosipho globiformans TaxID=380685 RepID=UPI000F8D834E|nr:CRISPR-associated endonuclease Cas2 [Thermosipho globiformans]